MKKLKQNKIFQAKSLSALKGAGLIEVMVSLLILGVGLLGVLSLQASGLNSNQRAVFVSDAQLIAQDMAARILAFGSTDSNSNRGETTGSYRNIDVSKVANVTFTNTCSSACNAAQTLTFDTESWQQLISSSSLPRGRGTVTWNSPVYTIRVMWDQERSNTGTVSCTRNNCYTLQIRTQPAP